MKKILAILLAICLCGISLSACTPKTESPTGSEPEQLPADGRTVIDSANCAVCITGIDPDGSLGYTLHARLENRSSDFTYMFSVTGASVNGVQTDPAFSWIVVAETTETADICFADPVLAENGIMDFTDIRLSFRVSDLDAPEASPIAEETVHIYPQGEDKATVFTRQPQGSDQILVDTETVTATVIGYVDDPVLGYTAKVFLQNKTDKTLVLTVDDAAVNGYPTDPLWAMTLAPGDCAFGGISWPNEALNENGIMDVESIEFLFRAYNQGDIEAADLVRQQITLKP